MSTITGILGTLGMLGQTPEASWSEPWIWVLLVALGIIAVILGLLIWETTEAMTRITRFRLRLDEQDRLRRLMGDALLPTIRSLEKDMMVVKKDVMALRQSIHGEMLQTALVNRLMGTGRFKALESAADISYRATDILTKLVDEVTNVLNARPKVQGRDERGRFTSK